MSQVLKALVMAIMAAMAVALYASAAAEARGGGRSAPDCKAPVRATGSASILRRVGRQNAVKAWEKDAQSAAGADYAKWENARKKNVSCKMTGRVTVRCAARAAPCR